MALLEAVLVGIGLCCLAVLLVMGAVALVRDWLSERTDRRKAVELVQREMAERRRSVPPAHCRRRTPIHLGGKRAA